MFDGAAFKAGVNAGEFKVGTAIEGDTTTDGAVTIVGAMSDVGVEYKVGTTGTATGDCGADGVVTPAGTKVDTGVDSGHCPSMVASVSLHTVVR